MSPANAILAANKINANVAGQTKTGADTGQAPVATTAHEVVSNVTGGLDSLVAGGLHPETDASVVDRSLQTATDSVRGPLGGLRPKGTSVTSPGPSGSTNAAQAIQSGTKKISDAGAAGANTVRKYLQKFRPKA